MSRISLIVICRHITRLLICSHYRLISNYYWVRTVTAMAIICLYREPDLMILVIIVTETYFTLSPRKVLIITFLLSPEYCTDGYHIQDVRIKSKFRITMFIDGYILNQIRE